MRNFAAVLGALLAMSLPGSISHAANIVLKNANSDILVQFPVSYIWEGITNLAQGTLTTTIIGNAGGLTASLGGNVGNCQGSWERRGGKPKTTEGSFGIWSVRCDNGLTAAGVYKMTKPRAGEGEGRDSHDRCINFQIGSLARIEPASCNSEPGRPLLLSALRLSAK